MTNTDDTLEQFRLHANPRAVEGMKRFGVVATKAYGLSAPILRAMAKEIGTNHKLALELWKSGIHDARLLAPMIANPALATNNQLERWVKQIRSWDVCDGACLNLFWQTPLAYSKALAWSQRDEEFVKRAGFVLMANLALHDDGLSDSHFEPFFKAVRASATDDRNFVKKAVNWALREMGKRNVVMNKRAIRFAKELQKLDSRSAKWIASDALRELTGKIAQRRIARRMSRKRKP